MILKWFISGCKEKLLNKRFSPTGFLFVLCPSSSRLATTSLWPTPEGFIKQFSMERVFSAHYSEAQTVTFNLCFTFPPSNSFP
jgi:hypothetical protein